VSFLDGLLRGGKALADSLCAQRFPKGKLTIALFFNRMIEQLFPDRQLSFRSPPESCEGNLTGNQENASGVESEDRRGLFRDAEGISQSLEDLIAASEPN